MKKLVFALLTAGIFVGCQDNETPEQTEFTGNESSYALLAGSTYPISGTVTFKEKVDGTTLVNVSITGTEGDIQHPVHLHLGNISSPDVDVSALLNPVLGKTGESETLVTQLADESPVTYKQLIALAACVKIHLSEAGPDKNTILAAGNIGASADVPSNGREGISVCKSE
jgi:hypothetical protein